MKKWPSSRINTDPSQRHFVPIARGYQGAFEAAVRQRAGALIAPGDPLVANRPRMVADIALKHRLPTIMDNKEFVEAGGLLSLGLDLVDSYRRAATHVDKILKGAHAAELPMEQPSKLDLAVNLKTARVLGLTIPPSVLVQATHVIE
jgi:putative tryptophan/tyrosine transport system substrate-binding protein